MTGAKIAATVAMTSMDMGTSNPAFKEVGRGHYRTQVAFSMRGPWRTSLVISASGLPPLRRDFDFDVRK